MSWSITQISVYGLRAKMYWLVTTVKKAAILGDYDTGDRQDTHACTQPPDSQGCSVNSV